MYFDALTVAAIADELRVNLIGGRVQQVLLPDELSLAFEIYANRQRQYLFASAHPQQARVHLLADKARRGVEGTPPLLLLLRKYVRAARLVDVRQPPAERILHLAFDGPNGFTTLIVEAIGRYSNLILVAEDGAVLDAIKRVGPDINRYRVVLPNHSYVPPPAQEKLLPAEVTELRLRHMLAELPPDMPLRRALVGGIAGISPLSAREIVFRALGDVNAAVGAVERITPLLEACSALTSEPREPCIVYDEDEVIAFAPYPLTHMGDYQSVPSISQALRSYFGQEAGGYRAAKRPLFEAIKAGDERLSRRRARLVEERDSAGDPQSLRRIGEAILAYAHQVEPGQSELVVEWGAGEPLLRVSLDTTLSPAENAQAYFRRYRKAERAAREIPAQIRHLEWEEAYLKQLAHDLQMAENRPEIDAVADALAEAGYLKKKRKRGAQAARPMRYTSPDGFTVWVGKNAQQNEKLTFERALPHDLWLHARGIPGAHVIVQAEGQSVPQRTVEWAAGLAAYYSAGRDDTQVEVDVVEQQHVRRPKGGRPGQVVYRNEQTLRVAPLPPGEV